MRIENHTERITRIPIMGQTAAKTVAVVDHVTLLPGVNEVDPAKWDKVKDYDLVKRLAEEGRRGKGFVVGDPKKSLKTLADLSEKEARYTVEDTVDAKLLAAWKASEKRETVIAAIDAQFEKIDPKESRAAAVAGRRDV